MLLHKKKRGVSKQAAFLTAFALTASVLKAAKAAKVDRALHYRWLLDDPAYAVEFSHAKLRAGELLEDEAVRRAHEGILEPVIYQGSLCYSYSEKTDADGVVTRTRSKKPLVVRSYSDGLLQFLLRGSLDKYKTRSALEVSGPAGAPIALENASLSKLTDEELAALIALASKLA